MTRILVIGIPRSGTTWVATMLARAQSTALVHEPDDPYLFAFALRAKRPLAGGLYTALSPHQDAPLYERLWREAFGERGTSYTRAEELREAWARRLLSSAGERAVSRSFMRRAFVDPRLRLAEALAVARRPTAHAESVIVKSVHAALSAEWLAARLDVQVVVVLRDLLNVLSSWVALGWLWSPDADELAASDPPQLEQLALGCGLPSLPAGASALARLTWLLGLLKTSLERTARAHPEWHVARHEELCEQPPEGFRGLAARVGLKWSPEADAAVAATDVPGSGYAIERVASSLPNVWSSRLARQQVAEIAAVLGAFPTPLSDLSPLLASGEPQMA